jgi:hypothetical protein
MEAEDENQLAACFAVPFHINAGLLPAVASWAVYGFDLETSPGHCVR